MVGVCATSPISQKSGYNVDLKYTNNKSEKQKMRKQNKMV